MFNTVKKKLRDGPGPNSYKQDADILDDYYNDGNGELGSLGGELSALGGSLGDSSMPGGLSENFDTEIFHRKDDGGGSSSIFGMVSRRGWSPGSIPQTPGFQTPGFGFGVWGESSRGTRV